MQTTSAAWQEIVKKDHITELRLDLTIQTSSSSTAVRSYYSDSIISAHVSRHLFENDIISVGNCCAAELSVEMLDPGQTVAVKANADLYCRLTDGTTTTEWLPQGKFIVDTQSVDVDSGILSLHGYDRLSKLDISFWEYMDEGEIAYELPTVDLNMITEEIAPYIGVTFENPSAVNYGYTILNPVSEDAEGNVTIKKMREVMRDIATAYAGNWIITPAGNLRLVLLKNLPTETNILVTEGGEGIVFGADRVIVY